MAKPQKEDSAAPEEARRGEGPHPIDIHVGSRVKLRRMILGMSQEALGKSLGLTFQQIQKYERGVNRIGASRIFEMSQLLSVPVQFFYDDFEQDTPHAAGGFAEAAGGVMDLMSSPEGVELCRYFSVIKDPKVRKRVLDLVKSIAEAEPASSS